MYHKKIISLAISNERDLLVHTTKYSWLERDNNWLEILKDGLIKPASEMGYCFDQDRIDMLLGWDRFTCSTLVANWSPSKVSENAYYEYLTDQIVIGLFPQGLIGLSAEDFLLPLDMRAFLDCPILPGKPIEPDIFTAIIEKYSLRTIEEINEYTAILKNQGDIWSHSKFRSQKRPLASFSFDSAKYTNEVRLRHSIDLNKHFHSLFFSSRYCQDFNDTFLNYFTKQLAEQIKNKTIPEAYNGRYLLENILPLEGR